MSRKVLGIIGARGGSQGVPRKNIKDLAGKPLITWTIERALKVPAITHLAVSTDDQEIAEVALASGAKVPFLRPAQLATSKSGKFGVWKHALNACEAEYDVVYDDIIDMDCTSPLLDLEDLTGIIQAYNEARLNGVEIDGMMTVSEPHRNPYFNLVEEDEHSILHISKQLDIKIESRQAAPIVWDIVAGFYILNADFIRAEDYLLNGRIMPYKIAKSKSFDIDEPFDAELVEMLMLKKLNKRAP